MVTRVFALDTNSCGPVRLHKALGSKGPEVRCCPDADVAYIYEAISTDDVGALGIQGSKPWSLQP